MSNELITGREETFILSSLGHCPSLHLEMDAINEGIRRIREAQHVNPSTYTGLAYCFNEGYRVARRHVSNIQFAITKAKRNLEERKADIVLDVIPSLLEEKKLPKSANNADFRNACFAKDEQYSKFKDRLDQLEAMESYFEGKIKIFENTCRYMRKQMDYITRTGYYQLPTGVTSEPKKN